MKSILNYFPKGMTPRPVQAELLRQIQAHWNSYDVIVVNSPVASGKSGCIKTVADWAGRAAILNPNNILVDQYTSSFPDIQSIKASSHYPCDRWDCCAKAPTKSGKKLYCGDCPYTADFRDSKAAKVTVSTAHMYLALRKKSPVIIADEAHNLVRIIQDMKGKKIWPHQAGIPLEVLGSHHRLLDWCLHHTSDTANFLEKQLLMDNPFFVVEFTQEWWAGGGSVYGDKLIRGQATLIPCIKLRPVDVREDANVFWGKDGRQKIILFSATISRKDIEEIGLDRRRVLYLEARSPIPAENRPIVRDFVGNLSYSNMMVKEIAQKIRETLISHPGEKGFIHTTYKMAGLLRRELSSESRLLFHDKLTTATTLDTFKKAKDSKVMIGSGLYEGVSLDYDLARFQLITKCPWPSQADPAIKFKLRKDPEYYAWETIKPLLQASGRVCRRPDDRGVTYLLDGTFRKLEKDWGHLIPRWFTEALTEG